MVVLWTFLLFVFGFIGSLGQDNSADENSLDLGIQNQTFNIELFPPSPTLAGQTRKPRTLLKKLHSGAAFLTGLKLGAILSKKGFELGHGKIASAHSFQIFGKSVNSAMSLSYGNAGSLLPLVDDIPEEEPPKRTVADTQNQDPDTFHVTVIETPDQPHEPCSKKKEEEEGLKKSENVILLYQDAVQDEPETNFLQEHNRRVKDINESLLRRTNSKF